MQTSATVKREEVLRAPLLDALGLDGKKAAYLVLIVNNTITDNRTAATGTPGTSFGCRPS